MIHFIITIGIWLFIIIGIFMILIALIKPISKLLIFLGILSLLVSGGIVYHRHTGSPWLPVTIPIGLIHKNDVIKYALIHSDLIDTCDVANRLGDDLNDPSNIQLMINPQTKHYVFNYHFRGKQIPVYAVYNKINSFDGKTIYNAYLIPVHKTNNIMYLETSGQTADSQIKATKYTGYTYNKLKNLYPSDGWIDSEHSDSSLHGYKNYDIQYY